MTIKLCGFHEECFERDSQWGHMEGCMCKHLGEEICLLDNKEIEYYDTEEKYQKILKEIKP